MKPPPSLSEYILPREKLGERIVFTAAIFSPPFFVFAFLVYSEYPTKVKMSSELVFAATAIGLSISWDTKMLFSLAGMMGEVKSKIFVPFFTAHGEEGACLGWSWAPAVITRQRGEITGECTPAQVAIFL